MTGTLCQDQYTFLYISRSVRLKMRKASDKRCREYRNKRCISTNIYENLKVFEMSENNAEQNKPQMTIWSTHIACWISKATNTHSEYVILYAFTLQYWLNESASVLRRTYFALRVRSEMVA
jgi:hypothetical protein